MLLLHHALFAPARFGGAPGAWVLLEAGRAVPGRRPAVRCGQWGLRVEGWEERGIIALQLPTFHRHLSTKSKGPEAFAPPARVISRKNNYLLMIYSIPARGFTAALSVFEGTPPTKPLICKLSFVRSCATVVGRTWAHHVGCGLKPALARFTSASGDIIEMSRFCSSRSVCLSLRCSSSCRETKNPAYFR